MMYGEGPPPPTNRLHHHTHNCWPLIKVTAFDFHYVIVLRVAIDHSLLHFRFVLRPTTCVLRHAYGFNMRIRSQTPYFSHVFLCFSHAFSTFSIQVLLTAFAHIKGQQLCVWWCSLSVGGGGPSPYIIILWCKMVFWGCILCLFYKPLFPIFGLLLWLVQKTRLTSSLHFLK